MRTKFYYVRGEIFENSGGRYNAKGKALRYCKENNIDTSEIYELYNNSELAFLEELLGDENIDQVRSHNKIICTRTFKNANKDEIPSYEIDTTFTYREKEKEKTHLVAIINSAYDITKQFILEKSMLDFFLQDVGYYLEVYYLDDEGVWKEWKIGDNTLSIKARQERKKRYVAQKKVIRDRQKFDRLLKLREQGKITERQSQELYRLEKVFGGNNG